MDQATVANAAGGNGSDIGAFELAVPTAAAASVAGRVLDSSNRPVANAVVTLTDGAGATRSARTNNFGNFKVSEVPAGDTYIVTVSHRTFVFAPVALTVSDNVTGLILTANP